jgi:hypothetical protein
MIGLASKGYDERMLYSSTSACVCCRQMGSAALCSTRWSSQRDCVPPLLHEAIGRRSHTKRIPSVLSPLLSSWQTIE